MLLDKIVLKLKERSLNMEKDKTKKKTKAEKDGLTHYRKDAPGAISGINTPGIELPAFNPPVPNRAWTAMRMGKDISELTEEEKRDMYYGRDGFI